MENINRLPTTPCEKCDNLCCVSLEIDELHKAAGVPCKHLDKNGKCSIYPKVGDVDTREAVCGGYVCAGAGEVITNMFKGYNLEDMATRTLRDVFFSTLQKGGAPVNKMEAFIAREPEDSDLATELLADLNGYYSFREDTITFLEDLLKDSRNGDANIASRAIEWSHRYTTAIEDYLEHIKRKYRMGE